MTSTGFRRALSFLLILLSINTFSQDSQFVEVLENVSEGKVLPRNSWLINLSGDTVDHKLFEGKWLVVDYWSYGCKPCIKEFPKINELYQKIDHSQLEIISVFIGKDAARWKKSLRKFTIEFPKYYGGWTQNNGFLAINFQLSNEGSIITSTPQYVLIDPDGKIVDKHLPKPSDKKFKEVLSDYIGDY